MNHDTLPIRQLRYLVIRKGIMNLQNKKILVTGSGGFSGYRKTSYFVVFHENAEVSIELT